MGEGKWVSVACIAFLGAYVAVEAYYAGQKDGKKLATVSEDPSADTGETDSPSESSQPDAGE